MLRLNRLRFFAIELLIALAVVFLLTAGCGGGGENPPPPQLESIAISPANFTIALGLTQQFTATGKFSDGTTRDLSSSTVWSSSCNGIADVSATGLVSTIKQGTCTITGTSSQISGSTSLIVGPPVLASITVSAGTTQLTLGQNQQFTAMGTLTDKTPGDITQTVTWTSSSSSGWNGWAVDRSLRTIMP